MAGKVMWQQSAAAATVAGNSGVVSEGMDRAASLALLVSLTALTGGTAPTVTFSLDMADAFGVWHSLGSVVLDAVEAGQLHVGQFGASPVVLTDQVRVSWALGGTAPPTSFGYKATLFGRS